jgi:hypothetical protein
MIQPVNETLEYNTTDATAPHLTNTEREDVLEKSAKMAQCLLPVVTPMVVDDAYPSDEEGYRQIEDGWFQMPVLSLMSLTFDFTHLPSVMKYNQHWRIAIFVAPSVCEEQRCYDGGGRVRVASEKIILDPPSPLDMCTFDEPRCQQYLKPDGDPTSVADNPCLGKRIDTCDPVWQADNNADGGVEYDVRIFCLGYLILFLLFRCC